MTLLSMSRSLFLTRFFTSRVKVNCLQFHTLRKIDGDVFTRRIPSKILVPERNFFWIFRRRTNRELQLIDKPPAHYELIYRCAIDNYCLTFQRLGFCAVVLVCLISLYPSNPSLNSSNREKEYSGDESLARQGMSDDENEELLIISAFLFVFWLIHFCIAKIPMRIYCYPQKQKYLFYFYGLIPNQLKTLAINVGEIKHTPGKLLSTYLIPWDYEVYKHKKTGQTFLLLESYFRCPADLYIMLGLQKDPTINYDYDEPDKLKEKSKISDK